MECWSSAPKESSTENWANHHAMTHDTKKMTHDAKNDLSGLGFDPWIVVETREKWLSFALGSSQFLKYLQGNFKIWLLQWCSCTVREKKGYPPSK